MMLILCPYCGPRNFTEYTYAGDATVKRPEDPAAITDTEWTAYVYMRDNPCGPHEELWQHTAGCRQWISVKRDTLTHEIFGSALCSGGKP